MLLTGKLLEGLVVVPPPTGTHSGQAPQVWRAPGKPVESRVTSEIMLGAATVPVGGGKAWPGFETTRRAEGSRRGRRAGGPPPTGT